MNPKLTESIYLTAFTLIATALVSLPHTTVAQVVNRPQLETGSRGTVVSELQAALKLLGYYEGDVTGIYSQSTSIAVTNFQKAAGLTQNGIVDAQTWEHLFPQTPPTATAQTTTPTTTTTKPPSTTTPPATTTKPTTATPTTSKPATTSSSNQPKPENLPLLKEGMEGDAVKLLQQRLKTLGFYNGTVDGTFGEQTREAVIKAQTALGLDADGIVGYQTWLKLLR